MIALMLSVVTSEEELDGTIELPVIGAENAPNFIQFLRENGVQIEEGPQNSFEAKQLIQDGEEAVVLEITESFADDFRSSTPARIELVLDQSKRSTMVTAKRIEALIQGYQSQVAALRLLARGVSPTVVQPIQVNKIDLATPQTRASNILEMIGMFLIMSAFGCNMYIAIDATAGERERGSLEPLLIQPISRWQLVLGKWLSTVLFGLVGGALTLLCLVLTMHRLPLENIGLRLVLGTTEVIQLFLIATPLILFAGAAQLALASFAKSFKEAQTYLSISLMLPMLPGLFSSMKPMEPELWMMAVPALAQQVMTSIVLRGELIPGAYWAISIGVSTVLTAISIFFCVYLFSSEHFFKKG